MATQVRSLFDAPAEPVLPAAGSWILGLISGSAAVTLCVVAVALLGLLLMTGRLAIRDGVRVVLGCFVLLGASSIALGLRMATQEVASPGSPIEVQAVPIEPPTDLPPSTYDPYAGASLRRE